MRKSPCSACLYRRLRTRDECAEAGCKLPAEYADSLYSPHMCSDYGFNPVGERKVLYYNQLYHDKQSLKISLMPLII